MHKPLTFALNDEAEPSWRRWVQWARELKPCEQPSALSCWRSFSKGPVETGTHEKGLVPWSFA